MDSQSRKVRQQEVKRTGKIPAGSEVHFRHIRNLDYHSLVALQHQTEAEISNGSCHKDWGEKRLTAVEKLIERKARTIEKRRNS